MNLLPDVLETELSALIFDVSEANGGEPFDTLTDALSYADNVLLDGQKKGGMTIKYVQSSDNKYVQFRLMSDTFNTTVANWQGVDDEPTAGSDNLVKSGGVHYNLKALEDAGIMDSYQTLTPAQTGLLGYVSLNLVFGTFGTHDIYTLSGGYKIYAIDVPYITGGSYYFTITDADDKILE